MSKNKTRKIVLKTGIMKKQNSLWRFSASRGQVTVEFILMVVAGLFIMQLIINGIKGSAALDNFVTGPNELIGHMIANGNWKTNSNQSKEDHPNRYKRRYSWDPP